MGEWRYSWNILDFGTRWKWVVSFTLLPCYPWGNRSRYPSDGSLGGLRGSLDPMEKREIWPLARIKPRSFIPWPVFIPIELSRLLGYLRRWFRFLGYTCPMLCLIPPKHVTTWVAAVKLNVQLKCDTRRQTTVHCVFQFVTLYNRGIS
jgi:hypothetical protein